MVYSAYNLKVNDPLKVLIQAVILSGYLTLYLLPQLLHYMHLKVKFNIGILKLLRRLSRPRCISSRRS